MQLLLCKSERIALMQIKITNNDLRSLRIAMVELGPLANLVAFDHFLLQGDDLFFGLGYL